MEPVKIWARVLEEIKGEVGPANIRVFFSQANAESLEDNKLTLVVASAFIEGQLKARYFDIINQALEKIIGQKTELVFKISAQARSIIERQEEEFFAIPQTTTTFLNSKFTLENFVVGPSNNLAYAAAQAVTQNPGTSYNPLFIYGGTGVGKTHLMVAIGNAILKKDPSLKVIYCSSEKFMNDYVEAIQTHKMTALRNKYRSSDVLLIDDIQFFSGREGTQEEFFHTFNDLVARNSQMAFTSDRPPSEIQKLEGRLRSRFAGGLMIDIQPPNFDTRVAILKAKSQNFSQVIPEDSLRLIAGSGESSIRELEGKLTQIMQDLNTRGLPPEPENITKFLSRTPVRQTNINYKQVLSVLCSFFDINLKELIGPKRQKGLVLPRHIAMYILTEDLKLTVEKVGEYLGGRDHTTIMHGRDRIKGLLQKDREIQSVFVEIKNKLVA